MISALVELLGNYYASKDLINFEIVARSLQHTIPGDMISLHFLGLAYYRTGRVKEAIRVFENTVRLRPFRTNATTSMQGTAIPKGKQSATEVCYLEATRDTPGLAEAWFDLGKALQDLGKTAQAVPAFKNASVARPGFGKAILASGEAALLVGDLDTAEDSFSRLQKLQPNNRQAYLGLGMVYRKRRDFVTARACLVRARLIRSGSSGIAGLEKTAGLPNMKEDQGRAHPLQPNHPQEGMP